MSTPTLGQLQEMLATPLGEMKPFELDQVRAFLDARSWDRGNPAFGAQRTIAEIAASLAN